MMIEALRTPDDRFADLPGFPYAPRYIGDLPGFPGLRMHYLEEGLPEGPTFLCLHGQPTWSYLYRKMIPVFAGAGRVVAPDLFGFGRSDKPVDDAWYSFDTHRDSLIRFIQALDLRNITLVCQDWGGLLGLTLPVEMPERFSRLIIMNTTLVTGEHDLGDGFRRWRAYNKANPDLDVAGLVHRNAPILTPAEAAAYAAPFPDARYKGGVRRFTELVPDGYDAPGAAISRRARDYLRDDWQGQSFLAVGMKDIVIVPGVMFNLAKTIRNAPAPLQLPEAFHFVQEWGESVAQAALDHFASHGTGGTR